MTSAPKKVADATPPSSAEPVEAPSDISNGRKSSRPAITAASYSDPKRPHTYGEKKFRKWVFDYIGFRANTVLSVIFADFWMHKRGDSLKIGNLNLGFNKLRDQAGSLITKLPGIAKTVESKHRAGDIFMSLTALSIIGWLLLFPMKWMKDRELPIVKWFDKRHDKGRTLSEQEKHDRDIAYDAIAHKPQQTAGTVITSRIKGWVLFSVVPMMLFNEAASFFRKHDVGLLSLNKMKDIKGYFSVASHWVGKHLQKTAFPKLNISKNGTYMRLAVLTLLELLGCALTAFGMKISMDKDEKHRGHQMAKATKQPVETTENKLTRGSSPEDKEVPAPAPPARVSERIPKPALTHAAAAQSSKTHQALAVT